MDPALADRIVTRYPRASSFQRWHLRGRLHLCPYDKLLKHLTGPDNLLDVGCGFGHLAWFLRETGSSLKYYGTDIDERKIAAARASLDAAHANGPSFDRASTGRASIEPSSVDQPAFFPGDAREVAGLPERFGNILFLDVIYLMPWELQLRMLAWAMDRLAPGADSVILVKSLDEAKGFSGFRAVAEEWLMVRVLRRTRDSGALNGMRPFPEYAAFARERGFRCAIDPLGTFNPSSLLRFTR
ncbi:MAG: class I SAM-dependent methyltransferase [Fibrobacteres bacterium]|nr:class I SAM-dependent methyltransferase [Fibrobacterota bacterium]